MIDDHVLFYLEKLHGLGLVIVFISTSETLDRESIRNARPFCRSILIRANLGYDFASWKAGLERVGDLTPYRTVVLANDSVYGPIHDLSDVFTSMRQRGLDVWGITDSMQFGHHLQSYFLVFEEPVIRHQAFYDFWARLPAYAFKYSLVWNAEVGLSRRLREAGFKLGALCEYAELKARYPAVFRDVEGRSLVEKPLNLTLTLWRELIRDCGCPFVKVMLLRDNPLGMDDVSHWPETLGELTGYDADLIKRHLAR